MESLIVARLDDARYGAGPATVIAVVTAGGPVEALNAHRDRDGACDARLRVWRAYPGASIGDRVTVRPEAA